MDDKNEERPPTSKSEIEKALAEESANPEAVDTEVVDEDSEPEVEVDLASIANGIRNFFDKLVCPDTIEFEDIHGTRYSRPARIPAKAQIVCAQKFERIARTQVAQLTGEMTLDKMYAMITEAISDPTNLRLLEEAFLAAHPGCFKQAMKVAASIELTEFDEPMDPLKTTPGDLFPVEDMIVSLTPFLLRFGTTASGLVRKLTGDTELAIETTVAEA